MPGRVFLGLILCNLIWSANPLMSKWVLMDFEPLHLGWLRYTVAFIAYLLFAAFKGLRLRTAFCIPKSSTDWGWLVALGGLTFCFSTVLNTQGLSRSYATDNALLIATEPMITVFVAWVLLRERPKWFHGLALSFALIGVGLLSSRVDARALGNFLILISLLGEGSYSSCSRKLLDRYSALPIFGSALLMGWLLLSGVVVTMRGIPPLDAFTWRSGFAILYVGALGTTAAYLYWMIALTQATLSTMVPTLFLQPVMGAVWGYWFLGDPLKGVQWLGAGLILFSVIVAPFFERKQAVAMPKST